jgi:type II secretory pathway pseudopilin PulG
MDSERLTKPERGREAGFAIATLIVFAAVISILAAATIPVYQMRVQREREEELIFRGEEYVRAIQKYQRKYNVNPPTIDALLNTDGIRFVRRQYKDPISGEDFRIISVNPDGSVVGSNTLNLAAGTPLNLGNTPGTNPQGNRGGGAPQIPTTTGGSVGTGAQRGAAGNAGGFTPTGGTGNRGATGPTNQAGFGNPTSATSGIIGVGANKPDESIKVYNGHQKYSEWEFTIYSTNLQSPNAQNPNGQNPNGQNGQNPQNGQNGINPGATGNRGQTNNPFGQPANNPFVPGGGNGVNTPGAPGQPFNRGR